MKLVSCTLLSSSIITCVFKEEAYQRQKVRRAGEQYVNLGVGKVPLLAIASTGGMKLVTGGMKKVFLF